MKFSDLLCGKEPDKLLPKGSDSVAKFGPEEAQQTVIRDSVKFLKNSRLW